MSSLTEQVFFHLKTLFLFTKSDFKTTVSPCIAFGLAAAPHSGLSSIPRVAFWSWHQILCFNVANQALFPEEDRVNKPYRPIPAGRISIEGALKLRWALVFLGFILSALYSAELFYAAIANLATTFLYCELRLDAAQWTVRNLMGGAGYTPFLIGAALLAGENFHELDGVGWQFVLIGAGLYTTTYHSQDFMDVPGDTLVGRRTFPMVCPTLSRVAYLALALLWSFGIARMYNIDALVASITAAFACLAGLRFVFLRSVKADQFSFVLHGVWTYAVFAMMGFYRRYREQAAM